MEDTEHKTRDDTETVEGTEEEMMNVDDKEEKGRVSNRLQLIGMTTFGFPASMVLNGVGVIMPQLIGNAFKNPAIMLGTISAVAYFLQLVGLAASYFSDRCTLRLGRRRPFILAAGITIVASAVTLIIGFSTRLVWVSIVGCWMMFFAVGLGQQANNALVSDLASKDREGFAGSAQGLWSAVGGVLGLILIGTVRSLMIVCAVYTASTILSVGLAMFCAKEQPLSKDSEILRSTRAKSCCTRFLVFFKEFFGSFLFSIKKFPDFFMMLIFRLLSMASMAPIGFIQYYLRDIMGDTTPALTQAVFMLVLFCSSFAISPLIGLFNDATKRPRLTLIASCIISSVGISVFLWAKTRALLLFFASILMGISLAALISSSFPVNISVMPSRKNAAQYFAEFTLFQFVLLLLLSHQHPESPLLHSHTAHTTNRVLGQLIISQVLGAVLELFHVPHIVSSSSDSTIDDSSSSSLSSSSLTSSLMSESESGKNGVVQVYTREGYDIIYGIAIGCQVAALLLILFVNTGRGRRAQEANALAEDEKGTLEKPLVQTGAEDENDDEETLDEATSA